MSQIKYNNKTINKLEHNASEVKKMYYDSDVCYGGDGGSQSYDLCYEVTDDISTYTGTFKDVFDKSSDTWYKLNNLGEYEEYGIYGSGRNITTYEGKLTIDGGHEYEWNGSSWDDLGEVTGTSITIKSPQYIEKTYARSGMINLGVVLKDNTKFQFKFVPTVGGGGSLLGEYGTPGDLDDYRLFWYSTTLYYDYGNIRVNTSKALNTTYEYEIGNYYVKDMVTSATVITSTTQSGVAERHQRNIYLGVGQSDFWWVYYLKVYEGETLIRDFIPWTDMHGNYGLFDKVSMQVFGSTSGSLTASSVVNDVEVGGGTEYPVYYAEKQDPLDNLTFNSLADAEAYAYTHCVYDGMKATIDGEKYVFDSTNGWTLVPEYYKVEDVTPGGASGWTITGSSTYNPNSSYYDDFSVENATTTNVTKIAKVTIYGYDHFTYYLRSRFYTYNYGYAYATNVDELSSDPTTNFGYNSSSAITNTYDFQKDPASIVNLFNYRRVTYNNLDKTVEHTFYVVFYGRNRSGSQANATILIPKDQSQENWEQVTFSASTNIASNQKNLYIDGNNSTSGGTNQFYFRWMVGLPSGTHTGYTNYSNYDYCPNVTSSTFTSVAGNSRQVNFTYDDATNRLLDYYLVDTSGNTLSHNDTVYYNMTYYNPCNVSKSQIITMQVSAVRDLVKDGGSFVFGNSSNRHYIYGYQPPTLGTRYYVDNYQSTFDIVYTKLSEEAVTITYTTYDPNDSETPSFNTEITYPYSGGTTSATTLTSFNVPYTYPYTVVQTSNLFSADTYTYTAGQASRTITFTLYPNNREFSTVADMEAYQYAWEGMHAKVGNTKYKYTNGQWVEFINNEYEYIETENASGKFYDFITNFYPAKSHTIETKFQLVNQGIDWGSIVGWKDDVNPYTTFTLESVTRNFRIIVRTSNNNSTGSYPYVYQDITIATMPLSATSGTYQSLPSGTLNTLTYNTGTSFTLQSNVSMCLFGQGTANRKQAAVARMYYLKVYDENHNLVKHYVASDYNGTPCFYEKVDDEYIIDTYTGSNHGTLTLGNPVNQ